MLKIRSIYALAFLSCLVGLSSTALARQDIKEIKNNTPFYLKWENKPGGKIGISPGQKRVFTDPIKVGYAGHICSSLMKKCVGVKEYLNPVKFTLYLDSAYTIPVMHIALDDIGVEQGYASTIWDFIFTKAVTPEEHHKKVLQEFQKHGNILKALSAAIPRFTKVQAMIYKAAGGYDWTVTVSGKGEFAKKNYSVKFENMSDRHRGD